MFFLKLYYKLLDWEWYTNANVMRLFIHCLLKANRQTKKWQGITIEAGSFVTSYEHLAVELGLTVRQVRTALDKLKMTKELTHKGQAQYSIITVNNWNDYQVNDKQNDKPMTNKRQTNDKQMTTTRECNNDIECKNDRVININAPNPNNILNPIVKEFHTQMKDVLHYNIRLNGFQCDKVVELNQRIPDFIKSIPVVFERLKLISWNFEDGSIVNADVNWLLEKENYISVLNGKYTTKQQIIQEKLRRKELEDERR